MDDESFSSSSDSDSLSDGARTSQNDAVLTGADRLSSVMAQLVCVERECSYKYRPNERVTPMQCKLTPRLKLQ